MTSRPLPLAVASGLVAIIGAGLAVFGLLLLAVAAGAIAFLDSAHPVVGLLGALALVAGVTGAVIALSTSGVQTPTVLGLVLTAATVALLLASSTRTSAGIA